MNEDQDMHINAAFSTDLDAPRADTLENDFYASSVIPKKYSAWDKELFETKWFDYRMMTPLQATKAYMEVFVGIYRRIYAREFDMERAQYIKLPEFDTLRAGILQGQDKKRHARSKTLFVGYWHGRQIADALGMPYGEYIDAVMSQRLRRWQQKSMPQPQHLYHEYDVEKAQEKWEEMKGGRLYVAEHHAYLVQNYEGAKHQDDYHEYLFSMAERRVNPAMVLAQCIDNEQLPAEKVFHRVGREQYERVERHLS